MALVTSPDNLPYPEDLDTPDIPRDIKALANATQAALLRHGGIFADAAARDAAIPAPVGGQMCYLADTGTLQMHNGFVWVGDTTFAAITMATGWTASTPSPRVTMDFRGHCTIDGRCAGGTGATALIGNVPARYAPNPSSAFRATTVSIGSTITAANLSISGGATALNVAFSGGTPPQVAGMTLSMEYDIAFLSVR